MKNTVKKCVSLLAVAAITAAVLWGGSWFFRENYLSVDGRLLWRHSRSVILEGIDTSRLEFLAWFSRLERIDARGSGLTVRQYEQLRREYPGCRIQWDVPFQGAFLPSDTTSLKVTELSEEDVLRLDYFPDLLSVDGWDCDDYDRLLALQKRKPNCKVFYQVSLCGSTWDCDITELQLHDVDLSELEQKLRYLPKVRLIHLSGDLPEMEAVQALLKDYPTVALSWQVDVGEAVLELGTSTLDLSGFPRQDADDIRHLIPYLPGLDTVDLTGSGLPLGELMLLSGEYPDIQFLFDVNLGPMTVRSDAEIIDLSGHSIPDPALIEAMLPAFRNLKKVIMCDCGLSSPEMDALDKRHPDIRFVWSVNIGGLKVRTDETYFYPTRYDVDVTDADLKELRYCVDMICVEVGHMHGVRSCECAAYMPKLK